MEEINLGVRGLIEFVMRSGDIDAAYRSNRRMREGIRIHQQIQSQYGPAYKKEVPFDNKTELEGIVFHIHGRCDGLYEKDGEVLIDEIKSTSLPLQTLQEDDHPLHWAQVQCYAYFYCLDHDRDQIQIQLTYVNSEEEEPVKRFKKTCQQSDLAAFYLDLLHRYLRFSKAMIRWRKARNESIRQLTFPYASYRKGQRKMAVGVYQAIEEGRKLFVEAPTGIGKTMSAMMPAVASLPRFGLDKIFYLTARNTGQGEAAKALELFRQQGVKIKSVQLTAKEKICLNDRMLCTPKDCPYAKGHFDRVNDALYESLIQQDRFNRETVRDLSEKYQLCPHEFQLDLESFSDFVLGDYNYFFDPRVYLRREFDNGEKSSVVLVDEAHNLVDRSRDMYSAELTDAEIEELEGIFKRGKKLPQRDKVIRACRQMLTGLDGILAEEGGSRSDQGQGNSDPGQSNSGQGQFGSNPGQSDPIQDQSASDPRTASLAQDKNEKPGPVGLQGKVLLSAGGRSGPLAYALEEKPGELLDQIRSLTQALDFYLDRCSEDPKYERVQEIFFDMIRYTQISDFWMEGFIQLIQQQEGNWHFKIQCIDPSELMEAVLRRARSVLFFSATLSPMRFYMQMLGGGSDALTMTLDSPFPAENLKLYQLSISTRYQDRARTLDAICQAIHLFAEGQRGNYMIFFPSYSYMNQAADHYEALYGPIYRQKSDMDREDRLAVLENYRTQQEQLGFFVLGGLFSEAIDLPGTALVGACIVSVGLPGLSFERKVIQSYFDRKESQGFDYAYTYPGMNKVLQAAGRVIRSQEDRGRILLIDDRFSWPKYRRLMPRHWQHMQFLPSVDALGGEEE